MHGGEKEYAVTIDGQLVKGDSRNLQITDHDTEQPAGYCPQASIRQLNQAVAVAQSAFEQWRYRDNVERQKLLNAITDGIEQHTEDLAIVVTEKQSKPMALARAEVQATITWTCAAATLELPIKVIEDTPNKRIELHCKLGVAGSIASWNWPPIIDAWHIMPVIRADNSAIYDMCGLQDRSL